MAVKIRLARRGRKNNVQYDIVVADARAPRDGRFIEKLGIYNPNSNPAKITLDTDKAFGWYMNGAQPTHTVKAILSYRGVLYKKHLQIGVIKGAISQEEADKKFNDWLQQKEEKIQGKIQNVSQTKADKKKSKLEAETKVKEARTASILKKREVEEAQLTTEIKEANQEEENEALQEDVASAETQLNTQETPTQNPDTPPEDEQTKEK